MSPAAKTPGILVSQVSPAIICPEDFSIAISFLNNWLFGTTPILTKIPSTLSVCYSCVFLSSKSIDLSDVAPSAFKIVVFKKHVTLGFFKSLSCEIGSAVSCGERWII